MISSVTLPSFETSSNEDRTSKKPRIQVIEVRDKENPDGEAIAWLAVEREEKYLKLPKENILVNASISIHYKKIDSDKYKYSRKVQYSFDGRYESHFNSVSLTGGAMLAFTIGELMGQRIGTYLFNEVVVWAKQWPEAQVHTIKLLSTQAYDENKERRNRFYERFGIAFDYTSPSREEGKSRPMKVSELKLVDSWKKNIKEHHLLHYLSYLLNSERDAISKMVQYQRANLRLQNELNKTNEKPLRWALKRIWWRHNDIAIIASCIAGLSVLAWFHFSQA